MVDLSSSFFVNIYQKVWRTIGNPISPLNLYPWLVKSCEILSPPSSTIFDAQIIVLPAPITSNHHFAYFNHHFSWKITLIVGLIIIFHAEITKITIFLTLIIIFPEKSSFWWVKSTFFPEKSPQSPFLWVTPGPKNGVGRCLRCATSSAGSPIAPPPRSWEKQIAVGAGETILIMYDNLVGGFNNNSGYNNNNSDYIWLYVGIITYTYLVGGWPAPLKNMSSSVGMMTFPTERKNKNMFQTTNQ